MSTNRSLPEEVAPTTSRLLALARSYLPARRSVSAEYERGYVAGAASRDDEVFALNREVDFWYFRANNPRSTWPEVTTINSIIESAEAREQMAARYAELDRIEAEKFDQARALIDEGVADIEVAKRVGLFLPIVVNLREGVL